MFHTTKETINKYFKEKYWENTVFLHKIILFYRYLFVHFCRNVLKTAAYKLVQPLIGRFFV